MTSWSGNTAVLLSDIKQYFTERIRKGVTAGSYPRYIKSALEKKHSGLTEEIVKRTMLTKEGQEFLDAGRTNFTPNKVCTLSEICDVQSVHECQSKLRANSGNYGKYRATAGRILETLWENCKLWLCFEGVWLPEL